MIFQDRIHPQLRAWYDASAGFDFDHLETFVPQCNAAELANLKEDPAVSARDVMVPGPKNAPDVKVRIYTPTPGRRSLCPACFSTTAAAISLAAFTGRRPCASVT